MQQERRAHPRAGIGRERGQVAKLLVERKLVLPRKRVVDAETRLCRAEQIIPRANRLNAQVVILIHHDADAAVALDQHGGGFRAAQQVAADEGTFLHRATADVAHVAQAEQVVLLLQPRLTQCAKRAQNAGFRLFRFAGEVKGQIRIISRQPNAGGQHNIRLHQASSFPSSARRRSRISAACS